MRAILVFQKILTENVAKGKAELATGQWNFLKSFNFRCIMVLL
jgi:hypothetical protein